MRKKIVQTLKITCLRYPNKGIAFFDDKEVEVKNGLPGQLVEVEMSRKKKRWVGKILRVVEPAKEEIISSCPDFGICGGCSFQNIPYEYELILKRDMVKQLLDSLNSLELIKPSCLPDMTNFLIVPAPCDSGYRNKMEFSFGDEGKNGRLTLGIRKRDQYYEVVVPAECTLIPADFRELALYTLDFFRDTNETFYHRMRHTGSLRYLILRRGEFSGELLINLVTTDEIRVELSEWAQGLLTLADKLSGRITGILHTISDSVADAVVPKECRILWGRDYFYEKICGLTFSISTFSFFQTYSAGAELLYQTVREWVGMDVGTIYDLYCGTGTIAQILSTCAKEVIGIELVPEAIEAAKENARINEIENVSFIAGDVLKVMDSFKEPDIIILDPPRNGIHPKALKNIIELGARKIIYVSCKPTSLTRDLVVLIENGYQIEALRCHDMFPRTPHVEVVCLLVKNL